jgi:hypothetical protein
MIVKKIKNPAKSASKATRVNGLADYIAAPEKSNSDEKCVYQGSRGFLTESFVAQKAEMLALAQEAVRSRDPINHYVMSWKENEQPSPAQVEEAVGIFLKEMGLEDHQAIYGLHADTANLHLHVMVNRVHPDSLEVIKPNRGFDIEAAHRAIARIEHVQGWERERHGRYQVLDTGEVERDRESTRKDVDRPRQPEQSKRDMEERTGEKSAERIAIEEAAPVLREATSWAEVHHALAEKGMRYEKVGSGAVVFVGDIGVKASRTDRAASLSKMEKRLGMFAPAVGRVAERAADLIADRATAKVEVGAAELIVERNRVELRAPEPVAEGVAEWPEYIVGRRAHYAAKTVAVEEQKRQHLIERRGLFNDQRSTRRNILVNGPDAGKRSHLGVWKGKGELRQAMQSIVAAEQAGERASLKDRHQRERELLRERFAPYPDLEVWLRERGHNERAEQWRYRDRDKETGQRVDQRREQGLADAGREGARIRGAGVDRGQNSISAAAVPRDIRNYVAQVHGREVHYSRHEINREGGSFFSGPAVVAFIDKGREIEVRDWQSDDSLLAALQLSAQKWGELSVSGSNDYKARCAALAVEHGFMIVNPELLERIEQGMQAKSMAKYESELRALEPATRLSTSLPGSLADVYRRHYEDVIGHQKHREDIGKSHVDPSRVDAMIAVRMRVTGHDQVDIRNALRQCSPGVHGRPAGDRRDWGHYAERTAQYAFSPAGTRRFDQLGQYRTQWEKLEGRDKGALGVERPRGELSREKPELEQEDQKRQERGGPGLNR